MITKLDLYNADGTIKTTFTQKIIHDKLNEVIAFVNGEVIVASTHEEPVPAPADAPADAPAEPAAPEAAPETPPVPATEPAPESL